MYVNFWPAANLIQGMKADRSLRLTDCFKMTSDVNEVDTRNDFREKVEGMVAWIVWSCEKSEYLQPMCILLSPILSLQITCFFLPFPPTELSSALRLIPENFSSGHVRFHLRSSRMKTSHVSVRDQDTGCLLSSVYSHLGGTSLWTCCYLPSALCAFSLSRKWSHAFMLFLGFGNLAE